MVCSFTLNPELLNNLGFTIGQLVILSIVFGLFVRLLLNWMNTIFKRYTKSDIGIHDNKLIKILSIVNGTIEVIMYSFSILIALPLFIAFWIGVKTASRWDLLKKEKDEVSQYYTDTKYMYLRFLIGNAFNIIGSYIIAVIINKGIICF